MDSIVNTLSKVLEKIILARLSWHVKTYGWFSDRPHGFREHKSTESAAHQLVYFVEEHFSKIAFMGERIALAVLSESQKRSSTEFLFQLENKTVILENQLRWLDVICYLVYVACL